MATPGLRQLNPEGEAMRLLDEASGPVVQEDVYLLAGKTWKP